MHDGWRKASLGELFVAHADRLGAHDVEPPVLSLSKYDGIVRADEYFDKRIASRDLGAYKVVRQDDWAYSTIHIDEGSIARNKLGVAGVMSPMYTTMRFVSERDDPSFVELLVTRNELRREYFARAAGTVNRRRSLSFKSFGAIEVQLPPLKEQQRIVDLIVSLDAATRSAQSAEAGATRALWSFLDEWLTTNESSPARSLGGLCSMGSGPSWRAADECDETTDGATPVLGITNTPPGDALDLSHMGWVAGLPPRTRRLSDSSLLMIRTNGNRARIGNVYRVDGAAVGKAYSAFQIGIFPEEPSDRDLIYWQLRAPATQRVVSNAASGSTGLGNIAVSWLKAFELTWPDEAERRRLVVTANGLQDVQNAATKHVTAMKELRSAVLDDLLSGTREIPQSYDALIAA